MKDLLNNDVNIGDKVAFVPKKESGFSYKIHYGIITEIAKTNNGVYCKSLNEPNMNKILRKSNQIIKLS